MIAMSLDWQVGKRKFILYTGIALVVFCVSIQVLAGTGFFVGIPMTGWYFIASYVLAILCLLRWLAGRSAVYAVILITASIVGSMVVSEHFYDLSTDGRSYHTAGMLALANGWNPVLDGVYKAPDDSGWPASYINYYSKGAWLEASSLYLLTHNLNISKAFNWLWLIISLCFAYCMFLDYYANPCAIWLAMVTALCPVAIYQLMTLEVDGQLGSELTTLVCCLVILTRAPNKKLFLALALVIVALINIKMTSAIFVAVLAGGFCLWYVLSGRVQRYELCLWLTGAFAVGLSVVGFNPYITQYIPQTLIHGNPFYPTTQQALINTQSYLPADWQNMNSLERLARSLFSASDFRATAGIPTLKIPFTITSQVELTTWIFPETIIGGFGPLFGGILLVLCSIGVLRWRSLWRDRQMTKVLWLMFALVAMTVLVNPVNWWARLSPQTWLLSCLLSAILFYQWRIRLLEAVCCLYLLNCLIVGTSNFAQQELGSELMSQMIGALQQLEVRQNIIDVEFSGSADEELWNEAGIHYTKVVAITCPEDQQVKWPGTYTVFCLLHTGE